MHILATYILIEITKYFNKLYDIDSNTKRRF